MRNKSTKVQHSDGQFIWDIDNVTLGVIDYTGSTWTKSVNMSGTLTSGAGNFQNLTLGGSAVNVVSTQGTFEKLTVQGTTGISLNVLGTLQGTSARFGSITVLGTSTFNTFVRMLGSLNSVFVSASSASFSSMNVLSTTTTTTLVGTNTLMTNLTVGSSITLSQTTGSSLIQWPRTTLMSAPTGGSTTATGSRLSLQPGYEIGVGTDSDVWVKTRGRFNIYHNNGTIASNTISLNAVTGGLTANGLIRLNSVLKVTPDGTDTSTVLDTQVPVHLTRASSGGQYIQFSRQGRYNVSMGYDSSNDANAFGIGITETTDANWIPNFVYINPSAASVSIFTTDGSRSFVVGGSTRVQGDMYSDTARIGNNEVSESSLALNSYGTGARISTLEFHTSDNPNDIFKIWRDTDGSVTIDNAGTSSMSMIVGGNINIQNTAGDDHMIMNTAGQFAFTKGLSVLGTNMYLENKIVFGTATGMPSYSVRTGKVILN
jgi:hypothetical protein